jgi:hypothetical protein
MAAAGEPRVELWFVRHGESHNNEILSSMGGLGAVMYPFKFQQDPFITAKGVSVAKANGARLVEAQASFDLVVCSNMQRTIETAYFMFVEPKLTRKLYVVPFISELPLRWGAIPIYENLPLKRSKQIKNLGRKHGAALLDHLDFSLVGGPLGDNRACLPPSGDNFLAWLQKSEVLTGLRAAKRGQTAAPGEDHPVVRIAVVTHSHYLMKSDTLHLKNKPSNADIWTANLHVTPTGEAGKEILSLTDLQGWFRESVAVAKAAVEERIAKVEDKATRRLDRLEAKIEKVEAKKNSAEAEVAEITLEEELSSEEDGDESKRDERRKRREERQRARLEKKEDKLRARLSKKQQKFEEKKMGLEAEKSKFLNQADVQIEKAKQQQQHAAIPHKA